MNVFLNVHSQQDNITADIPEIPPVKKRKLGRNKIQLLIERSKEDWKKQKLLDSQKAQQAAVQAKQKNPGLSPATLRYCEMMKNKMSAYSQERNAAAVKEINALWASHKKPKID